MNKNASYYMQMFDLNQEELNHFDEISLQIDDKRTVVFEAFFAWLKSNKQFAQYYPKPVFQLLESKQESVWRDIVGLTVDDPYIERRKMFGLFFVHKINAPYDACAAAISALHKIIADEMDTAGILTVELAATLKKVTSIHATVVADTYHEAHNKALREQNEALMEMSTPVTQLWEGILLLPLVGYIDSKRAQDTMTTMLEMIAKTTAKVFILDISGIAVVDTAVANYLIKITKATRLMGCRCLISGISGSVAQTIVELGIHIDEVDTSGTMKEALNLALSITTGKTGSEIASSLSN